MSNIKFDITIAKAPAYYRFASSFVWFGGCAAIAYFSNSSVLWTLFGMIFALLVSLITIKSYDISKKEFGSKEAAIKWLESFD